MSDIAIIFPQPTMPELHPTRNKCANGESIEVYMWALKDETPHLEYQVKNGRAYLAALQVEVILTC